MKAYTKDIIRSISKGRKRFFAIMMITALGVCMLCGIKAACDDLRYSADVFFDEQNLYDISIVSTLGLTQEDIDIVSEMEGVEAAGLDFLKKLEPEIKLFSFDKFAKPFSELTDQEKDEELIHFRTGYSFAKKVVSTGECDVLILDEVLGLYNIGALKQEDLTALLDQAQDGMEIYLTGQTKVESIWPYVDEVTEVVTDYRNPRN